MGILCWMSCLSVSVFGPDMVLNQRQVLVIVSDWEPYLGSLFGVGVCGFPTFSCFLYIVLFSSLLKMYHNSHAAFWSASPSTEESRYTSTHNACHDFRRNWCLSLFGAAFGAHRHRLSSFHRSMFLFSICYVLSVHTWFPLSYFPI